MVERVSFFLRKSLPFYIMKFLFRLAFRVEVRGMENFKAAGERVLIISNHVSNIDAALIAAFLPKPVLFAINSHMAKHWLFRPYWGSRNVQVLDQVNPLTAKMLIDAIKQNQRCMIFPEGRITATGALMKIFEGPGMIADKSGANVLPIRIEGAQYSLFSDLKGKVRIRLFPKITLTIMPPKKLELPESVKGRRRRNMSVAWLYDQMEQMMLYSGPLETTLIKSLMNARRIHGARHLIIEDKQRKPLSYNSFIFKIFVLSQRIKKTIGEEEKGIGLMMPNAVATVMAFFAIQVAGRITAMLNFSSGSARIVGACKLSEFKTVITLRGFVDAFGLSPVVDALKDAGVKVIYFEDLMAAPDFSDKLIGALAAFMPFSSLLMTPRAEANDPAVMLFTSGSEGNPKGVLLSHRNVIANSMQMTIRTGFVPSDTMFCCLPMFHSFGLTVGILLPLFNGIKLFVYPSPLHYHVIPELVYETNSTILLGTDTFLSGYVRNASPYDFYALRYAIAGAEKLKPETRRAWADKFGIRIMEGYGTTETTPVVTVNSPMYFKAGSIGRVLCGIQVKLDPVPGIENGYELIVKGPNIMLGYMKEDAPGVLQPPKDGWYDTGDVVSMDEDGFVTILGRTKRFAKIGGEMVSLGAVEALIYSLWPENKHAVVSVPHPRKGEMVVLITDNREIETDAMMEPFRVNGLTELSLPRRVIKVSQFPLLGSGKTDYIKARSIALDEIGAAE
ncbi:MAG: AMP-binding protein [Alphaproteobacteria bacterium]|nr:AMP-binding protein [Alphaproteobacteria bacterium]